MKQLSFIENIIFYILLFLLFLAIYLIFKAIPGEGDTVFRSKHDLTYLSDRAIAKGGVGAMEGVTYIDCGKVYTGC